MDYVFPSWLLNQIHIQQCQNIMPSQLLHFLLRLGFKIFQGDVVHEDLGLMCPQIMLLSFQITYNNVQFLS
jgi:hypothetical protein